MERILKIWKSDLDVKAFKSLATKFKTDFKKILNAQEATLTKFSVGHYYFSGFFRTKDNTCYYFSISDIRYSNEKILLYRGAKNETDYKGGINRYARIEKDMSLNLS